MREREREREREYKKKMIYMHALITRSIYIHASIGIPKLFLNTTNL